MPFLKEWGGVRIGDRAIADVLDTLIQNASVTPIDRESASRWGHVWGTKRTPPDRSEQRQAKNGLCRWGLGVELRVAGGWFDRRLVRPVAVDPAQVVARRAVRSLRRLWTEQMSRHSLAAAWIPRREKRRNRRFALMLPNTGSTVILRLA